MGAKPEKTSKPRRGLSEQQVEKMGFVLLVSNEREDESTSQAKPKSLVTISLLSLVKAGLFISHFNLYLGWYGGVGRVVGYWEKEKRDKFVYVG
jgi:hypothetical protein